jgi:hypothetical protein
MKMKDAVDVRLHTLLTTALVRVSQLHDVGALSSEELWPVMYLSFLAPGDWFKYNGCT